MAQDNRYGLRRLDNNKDTRFDIIIVLDTELAEKSVPDQTGSLFSLIKETTDFARVYEYKADWKCDPNVWRAVLQNGDLLSCELEDKQSKETPVQIPPLLFICYGFGGIVIKQASVYIGANIARQTYERRVASMAELTSVRLHGQAIGILGLRERTSHSYEEISLATKHFIFVGVPHPKQDNRSSWIQLDTHLIAYQKYRRHRLQDFQAGHEDIANSCKNFEEYVNRDSVFEQIYTFYETRETTYSWHKIIKKKSLIMGERFGSIDIAKEHIPLDTDYFDMVQIDRCQTVAEVVAKAVKKISAHRPFKLARDSSGRSKLRSVSIDSSENTSSTGVPTPTANSPPDFEYEFTPHGVPQMPCHYLKQIDKNRNFVGRPSIISRMDGALDLTDDQGIRSFALCGLGGMGKTQLAMHYALERKDRFDAIFWIPADEFIKISKSFCEIAEALHLVEPGQNEEPTVSRDLVLEWLSDPRTIPAQQALETNVLPGRIPEHKIKRANWLLIFDNVDDLDLVAPFWPKSSHGPHRASILVTSRLALAKSELAMDGMDLPLMTTEECVTLFCKQLRLGDVPDQTRTTARDLVETVGCQPLMVTTLAAYIRQSSMNVQEFSQRYEHQDMLRELAKVKGLPPYEKYRHTINTVWRFETLAPKARGLLYTMAFLDNDAVPGFLLEHNVSSMVRELNEATESYDIIDYPRPGGEYIEARSKLMQTSLVHFHETSRYLSWHRIVQEVVAWKMDDSTKIVFLELVVHLLYQAWPFQADRFTGEDIRDQKRNDLLPHVLRIAKNFSELALDRAMSLQTMQKLVKLLQTASLYAPNIRGKNREVISNGKTDPPFTILQWTMANHSSPLPLSLYRFLVQTFQFAQVEELLELGVRICQDHGDAMLKLLADVYFTYTRYGAVTNMDPQKVFHYCQRFYDICKARDDGSITAREDVATAHTILGTGFLLLDSFSEAVEHCQQCIDLEASLPDHVEEGAISQFALIYQAWGYIGLGQFELAAQQAQFVIDYRGRKFGPNDNNSDKLGLALQCLGRARELQGRMHECIGAYVRAKRNYSVFGSADNFRKAQVSLKLGELYSSPKIDGNHIQQAPLFITDAIDIFRKNPIYKRELARALFKKHQCEILRGKAPYNLSSLQEAQQLYYELCPDSVKPKEDLGEEDFDKVVRFWSR